LIVRDDKQSGARLSIRADAVRPQDMTIPLWSLLVASLLPYIWFGVASGLRKQEFGVADNRHPRLQEAQQTDRGARAMGASANAFEALSVFAPAVIVAHLRAAGSPVATVLAIAWLLLRVVHGIAYLGDKPALRTACFALASVCAIALYFVAAHML
jgi:uncharacterized MAPEG superfamily protein